MTRYLMILAMLLTGTAGAEDMIAWKHGYKTDHVVATRYTNPHMGRNVGFDFPKNAYDADRVEIGEIMERHGGWVYQSGGYPGATMYVRFRGVDTKEDNNRKIREVLPELERFMASLKGGTR